MTAIQGDYLRDGQSGALRIVELAEGGYVVPRADILFLERITGTRGRNEAIERTQEDAAERRGFFAPIPTASELVRLEATSDTTARMTSSGGPGVTTGGGIPRVDDERACERAALADLAAACCRAFERGVACGMELADGRADVWHLSRNLRYPGRVALGTPTTVKQLRDQIARINAL